MLHRRFSLDVPSVSEKYTNARPSLYKFDKELKEQGYVEINTRLLSDNPKNLAGGRSFMRTTEYTRTMISDNSVLILEADELIQQDNGKNYHMAGIKGTISVCEEKDLDEFKQLIKNAFGIEDLKLNEIKIKK